MNAVYNRELNIAEHRDAYIKGNTTRESLHDIQSGIYAWYSHFEIDQLITIWDSMKDSVVLSDNAFDNQLILTCVDGSINDIFKPLCINCNHPIESAIIARVMVGNRNSLICNDCKDNLEYCDVCGNTCLPGNSELTVDGESIYVCNDCKDELEQCYHCDNFTGDAAYVNDDIWCQDCVSNYSFYCESCGDLYDSEVDEIMQDDSENIICEQCYDNNYTTCDSCGDIVNYDHAQSDNYGGTFCQYCYSEHCEVDGIHDYDYIPRLNFLENEEDSLMFDGSSNKLYFGVELETECDYNKESAVSEVLQLSDHEDKFYLKDDCSLNDGFELVTHPATLNYHKGKMNWDSICEVLESEGCDSDNRTCGLHVHFSRAYLSTEDEIKIGYLVNKFSDKFTKLARRNSTQWCEFKNKPLNESAIKSNDRYEAVNFTNRHTLELRIFRGTLESDNILAAIQLCYLLVSFAQLTYIGDYEQDDIYTKFELMIELHKTDCNELYTYYHKMI